MGAQTAYNVKKNCSIFSNFGHLKDTNDTVGIQGSSLTSGKSKNAANFPPSPTSAPDARSGTYFTYPTHSINVGCSAHPVPTENLPPNQHAIRPKLSAKEIPHIRSKYSVKCNKKLYI